MNNPPPAIRNPNCLISNGNSFYGDVVSDSFKKTSRDEDNILDQISNNRYVRIIIKIILMLYNILRKCILTLQ